MSGALANGRVGRLLERLLARLPGPAMVLACLGLANQAAAQANPGAPTRPQLDATATARHQVTDYLAQGPTPWQPVLVDARRWRPDFTVAADGSGTHRSVQAAVDAVPALADSGAGARRWVVQIRPGTYRGPLCVQGKAPLTLVGVPGDAAAVTLVDGRYNGLPKRAGTDAAQPCHPHLAAATHGTSGSATAIIASADVLLAHLRFANDATDQARITDGPQAVALMTAADRVQLEDVHLVSHQDTFYVKRPARGAPARVFVRGSLIAGDVDFVFGNATLVIDDSTLLSRAGRRPGVQGGHVLAPSTPAAVPLGFLVQRSRFVADLGLADGSVSLGRAWDEAVPAGQWQAGTSPNGQALVRDSQIGPHIGGWAASTARRPFQAAGPDANRFAEFNNTALPADTAREVLAPGDGWAAADGGTRGGADAAPQDVLRVHNRRELAAALQPHPRPRIVMVLGRIDLATDDAGRPLGADHFGDPGFSWPAFAAAYDPATWGRRPPAGPLEDARRRSAAAQAAQVLLKVPSRTTLIGIGTGAQIVNGGLVMDQVQDVILRNLHLRNAQDHFPAWDPADNGHGEWNAEFDNLVLRGAQRVWVDHCTLDDGEPATMPAPVLLGRPLQRHDGLLDIIRGSTHVTVSWNHFRHHGKTVLVGNSDRQVADDGRLKVSFHHNLWEQTRERSPRVRYGQVHVFNNLYLVHDSASFGHSLGVGLGSAIVSQHNAWETPPDVPPQRLLRRLGGMRFSDQGSLHNGQPLDLLAAWRATAPGLALQTDAGWLPSLVSDAPTARLDPAADVPTRVRAGAGAGRLWTGPTGPTRSIGLPASPGQPAPAPVAD